MARFLLTLSGMRRQIVGWAALGAALILVVGQLASSAVAAGGTPRTGGSTLTAAQTATSQQQAATDAAYGKLPLSFEVNAGQADASARFLAHGKSYTLALGAQSVTLALAGSPPQSATRSTHDPASLLSRLSAPGPRAQLGGAALQMTWVGGNPHAQLRGEDPLPGTVNYFVGKDSSQWHTNIATYAKVRYADIYPGIDLVYYGSQSGQLEYDLVVKPGANPAAIALAYSGATGMSLDEQGTLNLRLANGQTLAQPAPTIYQTVNGVRQAVSGGYTLDASGRVGFALGAYDSALPLVIDPQYRYVTYLGGSNDDTGRAITVDSAGNAYIAGSSYASPNFPTTPGAYDTSTNCLCGFVTKLNAAGTALVYSTFIGHSYFDNWMGIAVDGTGNAFIAGSTSDSDFPTTSGAFKTTLADGDQDPFVMKLNPTGTALVYSTLLGGSNGDIATGLALDSSGNAYVTGQTFSTDFPTTPGAFRTTYQGGVEDAYVTKLNATGTHQVYSTYLGGSGDDWGNALAIDSSGNAYVTGYTYSSDFPTTLGAYDTTFGGNSAADAFVTKVNAAGSQLVYSTYLGGNFGDTAFGIAVNSAGNAYVTGFTNSHDFPVTTSAMPPTINGDAFITEFNTTGTGLVYSTLLGGTGTDEGDGIAIDGAGYVYIVGYTNSSDFPTVSPLQSTYGGSNDMFVARLSPSASVLFATYLGGSGNEFAHGIALGSGGNVYITGETQSSDLPHPNALYPTYGGGTNTGDAVIGKLNVWPTPVLTAGAYDPASAVYFLRNSNSSGNSNNQFAYGPANCTPLAGDWNGKGYDSIGVYCPSSATFYLKNSNSGGNADLAFRFGPLNCQPLVGDWTGKGYDSVGVDCNGTFYLRNANAGGNADAAILYGPTSGCSPIAGDWTRKGYDSIGIYCSGVFYLRNTNTAGNADFIVGFGPVSGCLADTGDWTGKGYDSIGVDCAGTFYLRNSDTPGNADIAFVFGAGSFKPLAGQWALPAGG